MVDLRNRLAAETLGTALLLAIVIGSGIMAERLAGGNVAVALPANTAATVGGLYILIEVFGPISGAHFNPVVSSVMVAQGELPGAAIGLMLHRMLEPRHVRRGHPNVIESSGEHHAD